MTKTKYKIEPALAQFNKISGAFICFMSDVDIKTLDSTYFVYVRVEVDHEHQTVQGRYPDFKIVNIDDLPLRVYERVMNATCREKITKEFDPVTQLDRIRNVVQAMAEKLGVEVDGLKELQEMNAYIDEVKRANKALKRSYQNNPDFDYVTIEREQAERDAQLEGGLHELVYGPREIKL